ncbi:protein turtle homolog B-like [Amphiura filiformis]|uniref:protein turtle homolog B-like n=1 Tax=Amphiura filiformis TaxID=82378 RepID=UPI003B214AF5
MELVLYLSLLLWVSLPGAFGIFTDQPPGYIVALQGDTILLRCGVSYDVRATLSWQRRDTGAIVTKGNVIDPEHNYKRTHRNRISLIGDRASGEYHLQIRNTIGIDTGEYWCHYFDERAKTDRFSNAVTVSVFTPPDKGFPACSMDPPFATQGIGETVTLICESQGGNPPAALTWFKGRTPLSEKITPIGFRPESRLTITLAEQDLDVNYACLARNPSTNNAPLSCFLKPLRSSVGLKLKPSTHTADPGMRAAFTCTSEVVPGLVYKWYVNDKLVKTPHRRFSFKRGGARLIIFPVIHSDDRSMIKCVVEQPDATYNLTGSASALLWVNVDANPNFVWETTTAPPLPTTKEVTTPMVTTPKITTPKVTTSKATTQKVTTQVPTTKKATTSQATTVAPTRRSATKKTMTEQSNIICRGDTCMAVTTKNTPTSSVNVTDPSNKIDTQVTTEQQKQDSDFGGKNDVSSISSKHKSSDGPNGLAVGLPLGFIFLAIVIAIVVFLIWKHKTKDQKGKGKKKQNKKQQSIKDKLNKITILCKK